MNRHDADKWVAIARAAAALRAEVTREIDRLDRQYQYAEGEAYAAGRRATGQARLAAGDLYMVIALIEGRPIP